jgi:chaperonin GroES
MSLKPIRDRIIIQPLEPETVTTSGIVIPDSATEKPMKGTVLSVGTGRITNDGNIIALEVKEGDVVLYGKYAGQSVKIENVDYLVMKEDDVLAIIE